MIKEITRSLSARLVAVFFLTSLVYGFGSIYAVSKVRETDYLREIVGSHISLHADLVLKEIGTPPDPAKAKAIVDRIPVDIRISSPGFDWSSDPGFPDLARIPFGPIAYLGLDDKSSKDIESWSRGLERVRFARYQGHIFAELKEGPNVVVFASPRLAEVRRRTTPGWSWCSCPCSCCRGVSWRYAGWCVRSSGSRLVPRVLAREIWITGS